MTDPASDHRSPGDQRLARPPSDRYRPAPNPNDHGGDDARTVRVASPARAVGLGSLAALAGAAVTVVLGGVVAVSAGLLVVAAATGYAVGLAVTAASDGVSAGSRASRGGSRPWIAAGIAIAGVVIGQVGLWLFARAEGGVLALPDYLGQTFGPLVPLQAVLAGGVAWWRSR